tara:strand:+ start:288 stop:461 length:174 start_codon:yes stop_codon:yes gene_type:complete
MSLVVVCAVAVAVVAPPVDVAAVGGSAAASVHAAWESCQYSQVVIQLVLAVHLSFPL